MARIRSSAPSRRYEQRHPEKTPLHKIVSENLESWLAWRDAAEGSVRLSAQRPGFAEKAAIADDLIQRYRNAFNELAK